MSQATVPTLRVVTEAMPKMELAELPIADLAIGDDFRLDDDLDDLSELAASIRERGVLEPLLVRPLVGCWEVVAGRRRLAASRMAGLETVPCIIRVRDDDEAADDALAENLHRRNLSPIEEGMAFARLRAQGLNQTQIAKKVGRSQTHVSMLLRLLEFPGDVQDMIHQGKLSYATVLEHPERYGSDRPKRERKKSESRPTYDGSESAVASHWRRRHDRLVAGLHALHRAHPDGVDEFRAMVGRLLKLDTAPLAEQPESRDWRSQWSGR